MITSQSSSTRGGITGRNAPFPPRRGGNGESSGTCGQTKRGNIYVGRVKGGKPGGVPSLTIKCTEEEGGKEGFLVTSGKSLRITQWSERGGRERTSRRKMTTFTFHRLNKQWKEARGGG